MKNGERLKLLKKNLVLLAIAIVISAGVSSCSTKVIIPEIKLPSLDQVYENSPDCLVFINKIEKELPSLQGDCDIPCLEAFLNLSAETLNCTADEAFYWEHLYIKLRSQNEAILGED